MKAMPHGAEPMIDDLKSLDMSFDPDAVTNFKYFHTDPDNNTLDATEATVRALDALGEAMAEQDAASDQFDPDQSSDSEIPPIYTYWSQFIDHEMTARTDRNQGISIISGAAANLQPVDSTTVVSSLINRRTPNLELDALYGSITNPTDPARKTYQESFARALRDPINPAKMRVGMNTNIGNITPPHNAIETKRDLPRIGQIDAVTLGTLNDPDIPNIDHRVAFIGDPRNDENLLVAQFHGTLLHFHNAVVDWLLTNDPINNESSDELFERARTVVRWTFQWLVVNDFMMRILEPVVVNQVLSDGAALYMARADKGVAYMPLEFSTAAYRFGHSMIRNSYDYNRNFGRGVAATTARATLVDLFNFTGNRPFPFGLDTLPTNWIVEWDRFTGEAPMDDSDGQPGRFARSIDTRLAPPLANLIKEGDGEQSGFDFLTLAQHLARRNLRRGFLLSIPTGQAMATTFGLTALTASELRSNMSLKVQYILESGGFLQKTPLWFYILKEAEINGGNRLGLLGSSMVAETFIGAMLLDQGSYLSVNASWHPGQLIPGVSHRPIFEQGRGMRIADLLRFAGTL